MKIATQLLNVRIEDCWTDPDYVPPAILRRRAAESGGAGAVSGRPRVRRKN